MLWEHIIPPACLLRSATQTLSQGASGGQMLGGELAVGAEREISIELFITIFRVSANSGVIMSLVPVCSELGENLKQMNTNILD